MKVIFQTEGQRLIPETRRENYLNDQKSYQQTAGHRLIPETRRESYIQPNEYLFQIQPKRRLILTPSYHQLLQVASLSPSLITYGHLSIYIMLHIWLKISTYR